MTAAKKMTHTRRKTEKIEPDGQTETTGQEAGEAETFGLESFAKSNQDAVQTILQANQAMLNGFTALNQELIAFADHRMREEFGRTESLISCGSPEEALRVQVNYAQSTGEDYLREAQKLMGLMMDISRDCWAPVEERTRETMRAFERR